MDFQINDWTDISAIATIISAIFAVLIFGFGFWQLHRAFMQQRKWQTLEACAKYEESQTLREDLRAMCSKRISPSDYSNMVSGGYELNCLMVLNYLDGIAIGVQQGLYDKKIVSQHMAPIIDDYVINILNKLPVGCTRLKMESHESLLKLWKGWQRRGDSERRPKAVD